MKDGLICREELLNDLCEDREEGTFEFTDSQAEAADKIIVYVTKRINAQPTVPAVPLEPLCKLLAPSDACPPGYPGAQNLLCKKNECALCWKQFLTKWMEEQDAAFD